MATVSFRIRPARAGDAEALVRLQEGIYREERWFVGDGPVSVEALTRRLRTLDEALSLYLVAFAGAPRQQELCGWLELHRLQAARLRHVAVLTVAVAAPTRRQGVATSLLQAAYRWAKRVGVEKIQLNVRANNRAALTLYEAQGFEQEGRERKQIREGTCYEDNVLMAKFL